MVDNPHVSEAAMVDVEREGSGEGQRMLAATFIGDNFTQVDTKPTSYDMQAGAGPGRGRCCITLDYAEADAPLLAKIPGGVTELEFCDDDTSLCISLHGRVQYIMHEKAEHNICLSFAANKINA